MENKFPGNENLQKALTKFKDDLRKLSKEEQKEAIEKYVKIIDNKIVEIERKEKMKSGQEEFFNFILERVKEGKKEDAKALMVESFEHQMNGTFNKEYALAFMPRMISLLKEEHIEEVNNIMKQFASNTKE